MGATNLAAKRVSKQLANARRVTDSMLAGLVGTAQRVGVQTHIDGSVTISVRVQPDEATP